MRKKTLAKITLLLVSTLVSLAVAEGLFRWYEKRSLAASTQLDGPRIDLGKLNYNDTMISRSKRSDEFRILSFGDSFGYSIMAPPYSYSGLLEGHLKEELKGREFRVVNLGEAASTVTDYAAGYAFWSQRIEHDAVLFNIYMGNDILDVAYRYTPVEWQPSRAFKDLPYHMLDGSRRSKVPKKFPLRLLDHAYALYLTTFKMNTDTELPEAPDERFNIAAKHNLSPEAFVDTNRTQMVNFHFAKAPTLADGYRAMIDFFEYVSELRRSGVRTLVTLAPNEIHVDGAFRQRVAEESGLDLEEYDLTLPARMLTAIRDQVDPDIELLDLSPYFVCHREQGKELYYKTNTHWGPEGNALAGRLMASRVLKTWFDRPGLDSGEDCSPAEYYASFAKIPEREISQFLAALPGGTSPPPPPPPREGERATLTDVRCGSLDGVVVDKNGELFLWGWAYDPRDQQPAAEVFLYLDGNEVGRAPITLERPDVVAFLNAPSVATSGWNFRLPAKAVTEGRHALTAVAQLPDGSLCPVPDDGRGVVTLPAEP